MLLLGRDWRAADTASMIHRTRVRKDPRPGSQLWWWTCDRCPRRFGYGNAWHRIVGKANDHAVGRLQRF
jgi:hypothetical protein